MNKLYPVLTVPLSSFFCFQQIQAADKYIHTNSNWSTAVWFGTSSGTDTTTAPADTDNVFTNQYQLTVDGNFSCKNITLTSISNAIIISTNNTLNIYGTLTGPGWSNNDIIGGTGTVVFKTTSGNIISALWNRPDFENVVIDSGNGNSDSIDPTGSYLMVASTGKLIRSM